MKVSMKVERARRSRQTKSRSSSGAPSIRSDFPMKNNGVSGFPAGAKSEGMRDARGGCPRYLDLLVNPVHFIIRAKRQQKEQQLLLQVVGVILPRQKHRFWALPW